MNRSKCRGSKGGGKKRRNAVIAACSLVVVVVVAMVLVGALTWTDAGAALSVLPFVVGVSNAFSGVGASFKRGNSASSEVFTAIAEVNSISGPNFTRGTFDVTSLDSAGGYREFKGGFRDGGEVTIEANFTLNGYDDFLADYQSDSLCNYQIVLGDAGATTLEFSALVTALGMAVPLDDKVTMSVTLKISGQPTLTT